MKTPTRDGPGSGGETREGTPRVPEGDGHAPDLADLVRQREEFEHDVTRIEAALAREAQGSPALYERLLRSRRICSKLENRIEVVRLQQKLRGVG
jgi:hypothetical protein